MEEANSGTTIRYRLLYQESGGEQFRPDPQKVKCNVFAPKQNRVNLKCSLDPTLKDTLARLRTEEQQIGTTSSYSIVLLAAQGLELEKQWCVFSSPPLFLKLIF